MVTRQCFEECHKHHPICKLRPRLLLTERGAKITSWGMKERQAKYAIGDIVRHRVYSFRGVIFDVDPTFSNSEEWYNSIPEEVRPTKDQPFYHLFAENAETEYVAYVSEQNLLPDTSNEPVRHPQIAEVFDIDEQGRYKARTLYMN